MMGFLLLYAWMILEFVLRIPMAYVNWVVPFMNHLLKEKCHMQ